eukprot:COSAG02_NODE_9073_length_2341_cov_7.577163_2_plen_133_part_00
MRELKCTSYIQVKYARAAVVAALAQKHTKNRVNMCIALSVSECISFARCALAQDRHRGLSPDPPLQSPTCRPAPPRPGTKQHGGAPGVELDGSLPTALKPQSLTVTQATTYYTTGTGGCRIVGNGIPILEKK